MSWKTHGMQAVGLCYHAPLAFFLLTASASSRTTALLLCVSLSMAAYTRCRPGSLASVESPPLELTTRCHGHEPGGAPESAQPIPTGETMPIYDAAMAYKHDGTPLVVLAGKEYGTGSSRDWAAKGTALLGIRAVVAHSFERIHRSNLIGMGVLPCQFKDGVTAQTLGLNGTEQFDLLGIEPPPAWQGKSLLEGEQRLALFYTDYSLSWLGLRDGCWKYIYELESGRSKLFDLCQDAEERNDLATLHPERIAAYRAHVQRWSAAQKARILQSQ